MHKHQVTALTITVIKSKEGLTLYQLWLFCGEKGERKEERKRNRQTDGQTEDTQRHRDIIFIIPE